MSDRYAFVMMIHDRWWKKFQQHLYQGQQTHAYVNFGQAPPKHASLIFFYVTKPVGELAGYADFVERQIGVAEEMWKKYGRESALDSNKQYEEFTKNRERVVFIRFKDLFVTSTPIPLNDLLIALHKQRLARNGFYISRKTAEMLMTLMA